MNVSVRVMKVYPGEGGYNDAIVRIPVYPESDKLPGIVNYDSIRNAEDLAVKTFSRIVSMLVDVLLEYAESRHPYRRDRTLKSVAAQDAGPLWHLTELLGMEKVIEARKDVARYAMIEQSPSGVEMSRGCDYTNVRMFIPRVDEAPWVEFFGPMDKISGEYCRIIREAMRGIAEYTYSKRAYAARLARSNEPTVLLNDLLTVEGEAYGHLGGC